MTFTRSTLKPLQALPFLATDGPRRFGYGRSALLCASHGGEPMHVERVQQMLEAAGLGVRALQCGCHVPGYVELTGASPPASYDERHHNCSGKHAGFSLVVLLQHGHPTHNYLAPAHPLQQAIRQAVADVVGLAPGELAAGTDGCSAPNYAMPLANLARGFARLASGAADPARGEQFAPLAEAMTAHPDLVAPAAMTSPSCRPAAVTGSPRSVLTACRWWRAAVAGRPWP